MCSMFLLLGKCLFLLSLVLFNLGVLILISQGIFVQTVLLLGKYLFLLVELGVLIFIMFIISQGLSVKMSYCLKNAYFSFLYFFQLWSPNIYHVLHKLGPMSTNCFYCLEDVHFSMLNNLFYTSISCTIHTTTTTAISEILNQKTIYY